MSKEKEMMLYLKTERPNGRESRLEVTCHTNKDGGIRLDVAKKILRFVGEELKTCDAEDAGIENHGRLADDEFKKYKSWHISKDNGQD